MYKIRAILDVKKDVIRDVLIDGSNNLETLHASIANAFGFNGQEMASFYRTDQDWNQGEEIPLFDMSEDGDSTSMQNFILKDTLIKEGDKLIYVYDFMAMWTFFIEVSEIKDTTEETLPKIVFSFGDAPEAAPEKEFTAEFSLDEFDQENDGLNDAFDDMNNFENIDDYDI
ncbi:MAG: hypothetical protein KAH07_05375 [Flavobacteriaceae bacterium]|nr:hypothetical protein [Flavobacteriaceae bacterium]